jgi:predicted ATP-dependent endonuclease of OLD family
MKILGIILSLKKRSLYYDHETQTVDEDRSIDLSDEGINISNIISFELISARRDVANKDKNKTLSGQTSKIYKSKEDTEEQVQAAEDFKDKLSQTDTGLSSIYDTLFKDIADKVREFGGVKANESDIKIISTLQHRELLEGNTTVVYKHDEENQLPEYYNGLGYMNLISMIFEIEILVNKFKRTKDKKPADINLLFIEEPEAHTHPQMQYVFIKNIKKLLKEGIKREDGENRSLQYIISTHSACILADSNFEDVKYLRKESNEGVIAKNLKDLAKRYDEEGNQYKFLKQYLTINRAEIFFADKVVLIEGDTERILIPTIMHKIDIEEKLRFSQNGQIDPDLPLLSQNISIVEVGAHFKIFKEFIDFIGIKTLIITDIDSVRDNDDSERPVACRVDDGTGTSNSSIKDFYADKSWEELKAIDPGEREMNIGDASAFIAYQTEEDGYHARSFEDAFIQINKNFIENNLDTFNGLKNKNYFSNPTKDSYDLAEDCINKKTHFALDIVYHSDETLSNWSVPAYIKDGLLWLKKD